MINILYSFIFTIYYVNDFLIHPRDNTHSGGGEIPPAPNSGYHGDQGSAADDNTSNIHASEINSI